jgi:hypothetical protein
VTGNRTREINAVPIVEDATRAIEFKGLRSYDPAFLNPRACPTRITSIDGDAGILRYPIEEIAEKPSFQCSPPTQQTIPPPRTLSERTTRPWGKDAERIAVNGNLVDDGSRKLAETTLARARAIQ